MAWPSLIALKKGKITIEQRYYISSKALTRDEFARSVRGHWAIENSLHWVLDVTMGEDDCPIYRGDAAEILACIRHMGLNMLRAETSRKASIRRKQKIAGMSSEYLEKVLNGGGKREPQKIPPFRIVEFLGVVRGMTTRQRLPHLSEALWRDAETPGNSATPVPGPQ